MDMIWDDIPFELLTQDGRKIIIIIYNSATKKLTIKFVDKVLKEMLVD